MARAIAIMNAQPTRVLLVAAASVVAFIALAFPIYWLYSVAGDSVYDRRLGEGRGAVQVLFYTAFVLHMLGSFGAAVVLTRWMRAPIRFSLGVVLVMFVLLALPTLGALSGFNLDRYGSEFLPGQGYR